MCFLRTSSFLAERPLILKIASHLQDRQRRIRHLCVIWDASWNIQRNEFYTSITPFFPLHTLDIQFKERKGMADVLRDVFRNSTLKRLSLSRYFQRDSQALVHDMQSLSGLRKLRLESLCLSGFDLNNLFNHLTLAVDLSSLLSLTLKGCGHADGFVKDIGLALRNTSSSLQHIYAEVNFDGCLKELLDCSSNLTSAHLSWENNDESVLWSWIERNGPRLRSIGAHRSSEGLEAIEDQWRYLGYWGRILQPLPNLEQLGIQLSESDLNLNNWGGRDGFEERQMVSDCTRT